MLKPAAVLVLSLTIASAAWGQDEKITIPKQFAPGTYVITSKQTLRASGSVSMESQATVFLEMVVAPPTEEGQKLVLTFKRMKGSLKYAGTADSPYDTDGEEQASDSMAKFMKGRVGAEMEALIDKEGKILKVSDAERFLGVQGGNSSVGALFGGGIKGDYILRWMLPGIDLVAAVPKQLAKGDSWTQSITSPRPLAGDMKFERKYNLNDVQKTAEGQIAVIEMTGKAQLEKPVLASEKMLLGDLNKLEIQESATGRLDLKTGIMTSWTQEIKQEMELFVRMDGANQSMTTKTETKEEITVTPGKYQKTPEAKPAEAGPAEARAVHVLL